jgi:dihydrofolate synthase/folylpolyglutamate synthase
MITLPQHAEANQVLSEVAAELGVRSADAVPYLPTAGAERSYVVEALDATIVVDSPLAGEHQKRNVALAIAAAVDLAGRHGVPITAAALEEGIRHTYWPGRLERIAGNNVDWILDVAHNPAGAWALRKALADVLGSVRPQNLIFSCLRDKPLAEMAHILFPLFEQVIVAPIHTARAATLDDLLAAAKATGRPAVAAQSVGEALQMVRDRSAGGVAVVSGSVYLVGEARTLLLAGKRESR